MTVTEPRRYSLLPRLGIQPTVQTLVRDELEAAIARGEAAGRPVEALDAGCGRVSALRPFRSRIARLVGADIHPPAPGSLVYMDDFAVADLCGPRDAFPGGSFDIVLSSFTVEHFADPVAAFANIRHWLRPGGTLIATTVNRRHPFVAWYLGLPGAIRGRLQRRVKASDADAHPLVGACNDPAVLEAALREAGFAVVRVGTVSHLARAWGHSGAGFALGVLGDVLARRTPSRRSTLIAVARVGAV
jgi:SAM-dependent methyltransferase